jgi:outer membrane protein TolC
MERSAWAWTPAAAALLCWANPAASPAQSPPSVSSSVPPATPGGVPSAPSPRPSIPTPGATPRADRGVGDLPEALPNVPALRGSPARPAGGASGADTSALATGLTLKPAPVEPTDLRFPINLATALRLADARPLIVAAAQAGVWVAEADLTRAKLLFIPTLNLGFDYVRHDGGGPDFNKGIMTAPSVNFFYGGGGLTGTLSSTDALFQPLVARQVLNSAHWDIQSAKNDAVMQTADAYFRVHQYRGMYAGDLYTVERGRDLVQRVADLSREFVPKVEVDRARNMLADLEQRAVSARQEWRVSSANLTQVLRLDPRAVVVPLEHDHAQITLIDPGRPLDDLMPVALTNRPELASRQALVQAMMQSVRREKWRPLLPNVLLNGFQTPNELLQAGIFGLGPNSSMNQWRGRFDFSVQPLWELEAMGLGNLSRIKGQRGMESQAIIEFFRTQDMVAADVTRAQARVQSAAARVVQADRAMRTAIITFNGNYEGLQQTTRLGNVLVLVNRPQEAVFALQLLQVAFDQYFTTVAEYNRSQFELFHALGYPAQEVTTRLLPGQVQPVETARPPYLPPVGNGPPPATR